MALTIGELVGYIDLDNKGWRRGLRETHDDLQRAASAVNDFGDRAGAKFLSVANSLSNIPTAVQGISGVVSILGQMSGAIGLIPAAGAGAVAMIAALKLGVQGFGDAVAAADPEAFAEAAETLSPAARDAAVAVRDLRDEWEGMQNSIQERLFAGIADDISALGGKYIPVLERGLGDIAGQFGAGAESAAQFLTEAQQVATVDDILGGTRDVAGELAGALRPLVSILLDVAAVGMEFLPGLTGGFADAAESAAEFVRHARETGQLHEWISTGLSTIGDLVDLFQNLARIVGTVFSAFDSEGAGFLTMLVDLTDQVADFLQSFEGQEALHALADALNVVSGVVTDVMLTAFEELAPVIVELAPGVAELARQVGSVLVAALRIVGPLLQGLAGFLSSNASWLGPLAIGLYAAAKALGVVTIAVRALTLASMLNPWVAIIAATVLLVTLIITYWDDIVAGLGAAWDWIVARAEDVWGWIKTTIIDNIVAAAQWVGDRIQDIIDFFEWLGSLPGKVGAWFRSVYDGAVSKLGELVDWIKGLPGRILEALGNLGSLLWEAGKDILRGLLEGLKSMASNVIDWFKELIGDAVDGVLSYLGIGSPSKVFRQIGVWSGQGLVQGLMSMVDPVTGAAAALADAAVPSPALAAAGAPMAGTAGMGTEDFAGGRAPLHIENYHAADNSDPIAQAEAWDWLARGGG